MTLLDKQIKTEKITFTQVATPDQHILEGRLTTQLVEDRSSLPVKG